MSRDNSDVNRRHTKASLSQVLFSVIDSVYLFNVWRVNRIKYCWSVFNLERELSDKCSLKTSPLQDEWVIF